MKNTETEYRYLLSEAQYKTLLKSKHIKPEAHIEQHYLVKGEHTIRIRKMNECTFASSYKAADGTSVTESESVMQHFMTVKGKKVGPSCTEVEEVISSGFYESLLPLCSSSINKVRSTIKTRGGVIIELDKFLDYPLYIAEIELRSGDTFLDTTKLPIAIRKAVDITEDHRYSNASLSDYGMPSSAITTEDVTPAPEPTENPEFNQRSADRLKAFYALADAKSTDPIGDLFNEDENQFIAYLNDRLSELEDVVAETEAILQSSSDVVLSVMQELYNLDKKALRQLLSYRVGVKNDDLIHHKAYPIAPDYTISVLGVINGILHYLNDNAGSKRKLLIAKWNDGCTKLKGFSLMGEDDVA